jgi:hypothetical protein
MTALLGLTLSLHCLAGLLALSVARHRPPHRPVALFLFVTAITDIIHTALGRLVLWPALDLVRAAGLDPARIPFTGWVRVTVHVDQALFLTWHAGLAALALVVFTKLRPWPVAILWVAASLALALTYPITRGEVLRRVYLAADLIALAVAVASFASWFRRRRPGQGFTFPQLIATLIFAIELGALFVGAWRWNIFENWSLSQAAYATLYAACIFLQGAVLWITPSPSQSPPGSSG